MRDTLTRDMEIRPGQWRPHYPWEHIAWVSPPWRTQDYVWLDFPEAVFSDRGLHFLSHINPALDAEYLHPHLPAEPWRDLPDGITFERRLPNGVRIGGSVTRAAPDRVALELALDNRSGDPLTDLRVQTCFFLRAMSAFDEYTNENKYGYVPDEGWVSLADLSYDATVEGATPTAAVVDRDEQRVVAVSWRADTDSLWGNPDHPCVHADPGFGAVPDGERAVVEGELVFFEGTLDEFAAAEGLE